MDRTLRDLYDAVDQGDVLMAVTLADSVLGDWNRLSIAKRQELRENSIFSTLPFVENHSLNYGLPMMVAWAVMQGLSQKYQFYDRDSGELVEAMKGIQ